MNKRRIIKLTERQLKEVNGDNYQYLKNDDTKPFDGNVNIGNGKFSDGETDTNPITGDDISKILTTQAYNRYNTRGSGYYTSSKLRESNSSYNKDFDIFKNKELEILTNNDKDDDLTRIPESLLHHMNIFIDELNNYNVDSRKTARILYKLLDSMNLKNIPYSWAKQIIMKIKNKI